VFAFDIPFRNRRFAGTTGSCDRRQGTFDESPTGSQGEGKRSTRWLTEVLWSAVGLLFWGECGTVADPDGNHWWIVTHVAEPAAQEMRKKVKEQIGGQMAAAAGE
jgi:hypothetical protein